MNKYRVLVTRHESEEWIVEAKSKEEAMNNFEEGICEDEHVITYKADSAEEILENKEANDESA